MFEELALRREDIYDKNFSKNRKTTFRVPTPLFYLKHNVLSMVSLL